jgi:hypothetical protein
MTILEIKEMRRKLDQQYKSDRETLDRMLELVSRSGTSSSAAGNGEEENSGLPMGEKIADYVQQIPGNFTMKDARKFIEDKAPDFAKRINNRQAISTALWKLHKAGKIKVIIPKKGQSSAIYSKA